VVQKSGTLGLKEAVEVHANVWLGRWTVTAPKLCQIFWLDSLQLHRRQRPKHSIRDGHHSQFAPAVCPSPQPNIQPNNRASPGLSGAPSAVDDTRAMGP
jgi:hypothetical protein